MKILREIKNMFENIPEKEQDIFIYLFGNPLSEWTGKTHKQKQIIYNLLLWRTKRSEEEGVSPYIA